MDRYSQKYLEGIGENNYSNSRNQPYPIGEKDKDIRKSYNKLNNNEDFLFTDVEPKEQDRVIINNYNNINKYNNGTSNNKKYKSNYKGRDYAGFDFTKLYANADAFI